MSLSCLLQLPRVGFGTVSSQISAQFLTDLGNLSHRCRHTYTQMSAHFLTDFGTLSQVSAHFSSQISAQFSLIDFGTGSSFLRFYVSLECSNYLSLGGLVSDRRRECPNLSSYF